MELFLFEYSNVPTATTNFNFDIELANQEFNKQFGNNNRKISKLIPRYIFDIYSHKSSITKVISDLKHCGYWKGKFEIENNFGKLISYSAALYLIDAGKNKHVLVFLSSDKTHKEFENIINVTELLSSFVMSFPYGLYIYNTKSKSVFLLNEYVANKLGFINNEYKSERDFFKSIVDKKDFKFFINEFKKGKKDSFDPYIRSEIKFRHKNNTSKNFVNYFIGLPNSQDNKSKLYLGFLEDKTDKNHSSKVIDNEFQNLIESIFTGIYRTTPDGKILIANTAFAKIAGLNSVEELKKIDLEKNKIFGNYPRNTFKKLIEDRGIIEGYESSYSKPNGTVNYLKENARTIHDSNNKVLYYEGTVEDITQSRMVEEESYRALINSTSDAVYILKGRKLLLVNNAWLEMFGYEEEEVINDKFDVMQVVAPSSRSQIFGRYKNSPGKKIKSNYNMQGITKSGNVIDLEVNVNMLKWKGEIVYQGTYKNITEKRRTEEALKLKDNLLESTAKATYQLLTQPNIDTAINSAFDIIGKAIEVSRIYIFENYTDTVTNEHMMNQIYNWQYGSKISNINRMGFKYLSYKKFPGWYGKLSSGSVIKGLVKDFPDMERLVWESEKILSILFVPIFVNSKFWGIIGFGECKSERIWSDAEVSILNTAGNSFGNALVRKFTEQALADSESRYRSLFDQAADLIALIDLRGNIININKRVEAETGWKYEELIGKNVMTDSLLTDKSKKILSLHLKESSTTPIFEIEIVRKDNTLAPYELNIVPINKNGKLISLQAILRNIKERKESERSLRESEEKYRKIFENIQDIFYQTDINGKITTISPSIERYSGFKPEELIGKPVVSFYATPQERAKLMKEMQEKSEVIDYVVKLRNKFNRNVFVSVNSHVLRNHYSEIVGVEGSLRDVTEREMAFEEIRKLSRAVEQSPNIVTITDTSGQIEYVNPKFTEVTGYALNEVIGKHTNILKSGKTGAEQYAILWKTILSGKEWKGEFHNKKKNGELYWESASISPIKNENNETTHFLAVKEDITEKKIQEKRLHNYQNLLMGVAQSVQILISEKDFQVAIQNALEALGKGSEADRVYFFESVLNSNKKDPLMNLKFEWHKDGIPSILNSKYLQSINYSSSMALMHKKTGESKSFNTIIRDLPEEEQTLIKPHGTLALLIVPIYVEKQFWGFIGFDDCQNEEVWNESEESILTAAAASIGRAIEREKTNVELIRAKEEAEKAERLKSEFLAQISHEIRSPLNVLLNYSQLFKELAGDKIDSDLFQGFDGMENAGNRIIRTIDLLLNLSELQTNSYSYKPRDIDVYSGVLFPLFQEYKKIARSKNLIFNTVRHIDNTKVVGDEYSITQIFANLIDNAIKYTFEGKIEISIDRNFNNKLFVKVADSGIGISEYYLPNMYSPFTQEEQGYTRSYEGNGLGLALVKKYCELNNADIFVDSVKGKGTTFTIVFN